MPIPINSLVFTDKKYSIFFDPIMFPIIIDLYNNKRLCYDFFEHKYSFTHRTMFRRLTLLKKHGLADHGRERLKNGVYNFRFTWSLTEKGREIIESFFKIFNMEINDNIKISYPIYTSNNYI